MGGIEGQDALLNRMVILLFPISIPKEKQDLELGEKMKQEVDSIFSEALDELHLLQKNNFRFEEPDDTKKLKIQMASSSCYVQ
jgi:phage/plasmid-associated DNA primase